MNVHAFGKFIADRRKELGMTQKDIAERLKVTPKAVSRWERCLGYPDIEIFQNLAEALQVSLDSLFACEIRDEPLHDEEVRQIMQSSVEIERKNNRVQDRIVLGLIACVSVLAGFLFYVAGFGNPGGALFFGLLASGFVVSVYYLLAEEKTGSQKIYAVSSAVFLVVLIGILWLVL